jgi:O-antigen ligase
VEFDREQNEAGVAGANRAERLALQVLQIGATAVVLVASISGTFELGRFLVPKELALHLTAATAGLLAFRAIRRTILSWVDLLLVAYLFVGAMSALTATNRWLALQALAVSASGIAIFWAARGLREMRLARSLLGALAFAVIVAAGTSLLQAYGVRIDFFATSRAPGGTLGNRNSVAHVAALGLPVCLLAALWARRTGGTVIASMGIAIVSASLVLTRSRAAWLAAAAVVLLFIGAMVLSSALRRDARTWRRLAGVVIFAAGGVAAALLIPNTLRWRSDNPYLDSVTGVVNYEEGSGRGRLLQYERSLRMAARHPLLGVGPGNWPVRYPQHAARSDPSLDPSEPGTTFNPWPSSDWVAFASERGFFAVVLLALVFASIAAAGFKRLFGAPDAEQGLLSVTLLGTVAAAVIAGMFDAVLLLAVPTVLVWATLGSVWPAGSSALPRPMRGVVVALVIALAAVGAVRSAAQLVAMEIYGKTDDRASLQRAARIDPGNYRLRLRLARGGGREQRCAHAGAAHALFPSAEAARDLTRRCDDRN